MMEYCFLYTKSQKSYFRSENECTVSSNLITVPIISTVFYLSSLIFWAEKEISAFECIHSIHYLMSMKILLIIIIQCSKATLLKLFGKRLSQFFKA